MAQNQTPGLDFGLMAKFNIEVLIKVKPPCFKRFIHLKKKPISNWMSLQFWITAYMVYSKQPEQPF